MWKPKPLRSARKKKEVPAVSPEVVASIMSTELSHAIHGAAEAAADAAHEAGVTEEICGGIYTAAILAAASAIDANGGLLNFAVPPAAAPAADAELQPPMVNRRQTSPASRIEATLARAIKKNAVRVVDLFQDWDEDRNGLISKREFRQALCEYSDQPTCTHMPPAAQHVPPNTYTWSPPH